MNVTTETNAVGVILRRISVNCGASKLGSGNYVPNESRIISTTRDPCRRIYQTEVVGPRGNLQASINLDGPSTKFLLP